MPSILYSPGYGAGWSTWADKDQAVFLTQDPTLVSFAQRKATIEEVSNYLKTIYPDNVPYLGGWGDITIFELSKGTLYRIEEYDGSESVVTLSNVEWMVA